MAVETHFTSQVDVPVKRFTVEQYRRMVEVGILTEDDSVELLEGLIVEKMGKNQPHIVSVRKIFRLLMRILPEGWFADSEQPFDATDSEPEPDFMVIRGKIDEDTKNLVTAKSIGLVIEVADTTLARDRGVKLGIYARAGIPFYWIVNLTQRQAEVHAAPYTEGDISGYRQRTVVDENETVPLILDGENIAQINVGDMLP